MWKKEEKILLFALLSIFAFVTLVALVMLLSDPVQVLAKEKTTSVVQNETVPGVPSNIRFFDGKFYVAADLNDIVITGDDLGYYINGQFYAPVGGFMLKIFYEEKAAESNDQTDEPEDVEDDEEEATYLQDDEDLDEDLDKPGSDIEYADPKYDGREYGVDFVI